MEALTASRTALMVAAYRARASARPEAICDDPWAAALAGAEGQAVAARFDAAWPSMELWIALRTRVLDDGLSGLLDGGVDQVVLLGAGYDTRAARMTRRGLRFFEVDHPATQAGKLARLGAVQGYPSGAATHVACDFEHDDFVERLVAAGFDPGRAAAVIWEGVTPYLPEVTVRETLARVARGMHPATVLMFDFVARGMASGDGLRDEDRAMRDTLDGLGEPMRWGTNHVLPVLHEAGFTRVRTLAMDEACLQHTGTYERARAFRFQGVAFASVARDGARWI